MCLGTVFGYGQVPGRCFSVGSGHYLADWPGASRRMTYFHTLMLIIMPADSNNFIRLARHIFELTVRSCAWSARSTLIDLSNQTFN